MERKREGGRRGGTEEGAHAAVVAPRFSLALSHPGSLLPVPSGRSQARGAPKFLSLAPGTSLGFPGPRRAGEGSAPRGAPGSLPAGPAPGSAVGRRSRPPPEARPLSHRGPNTALGLIKRSLSALTPSPPPQPSGLGPVPCRGRSPRGLAGDVGGSPGGAVGGT